MPRERKGLVRKSGGQSKDPYVIFVIAAEGSDTEILYFRQIKSLLERLQLGRLVKVEPLERREIMNKAGKSVKDTRSSAKDVIELLDGYRNKYSIKEGDELWCVIDRDRWPVKNIAAAARSCRQRNYEFSMTTPCFELWLLLHLPDLTMRIPNATQQAFCLALEAKHWREDRFCTRLHLLVKRIFKLEAPDYHLPTH